MSFPTQYKISTITATGHINTVVNLQCLFDGIVVVPPTEDGVQYAELGKEYSKGVQRKTKNKRKPTLKKFDNQATLLIYLDGGYANCKVFKNGCIQITGLKRIEHGPKYIEHIIQIIKVIHAERDIVADFDNMSVSNYKVRLINTDFNIGFEIRRDNLFKHMLKAFPNIYTVFEPCIYSGVKINYYHNLIYDDASKGVCACNTPCVGKGSGNGCGDCNKITIAVFRSGSVLVTGGSEYKQIDDAYKFICNILCNSRKEIYKETLVQPENPKKRIVKKAD